MKDVFLNFQLRCQRSGVLIARVELLSSASALPYISLWNDNVVFHPVFTLEFQRLLSHTKNLWGQLAAKDELTDSEEQELGLCFLALLHSLDSIKQNEPALPPISVVKDHLQALTILASWKFFLESKRLKFPTLAITRKNGNLDFSNIGDYIQLCFETRKAYEEGVREAAEEHKLRETEKALALLAGEWTKPISKALLWRWIRAHLPEKYQPDAVGWLGTLFLGNKAAILEFEREDLNLMDEILQASLPTGTGIGIHVRKRIQEIVSIWESYYEAWEVVPEVAPTLVNGQAVIVQAGPEPKLEQFSTRGSWLQAMARWRLAKAKEQA
jgi:hypothetical protein